MSWSQWCIKDQFLPHKSDIWHHIWTHSFIPQFCYVLKMDDVRWWQISVILTAFNISCEDRVISTMGSSFRDIWWLFSLEQTHQYNIHSKHFAHCQCFAVNCHQWISTLSFMGIALCWRNMSIAELHHHWFKQWLLACLVPSHYVNQWWYLANHTPRKRPNNYWD